MWYRVVLSFSNQCLSSDSSLRSLIIGLTDLLLVMKNQQKNCNDEWIIWQNWTRIGRRNSERRRMTTRITRSRRRTQIYTASFATRDSKLCESAVLVCISELFVHYSLFPGRVGRLVCDNAVFSLFVYTVR